MRKAYYLPFTNVFNKTVYFCHLHGSSRNGKTGLITTEA